MLFAALLLLAQDVPAAPPVADEVQGEDIVVRATFGHTTMLFDKGADGKLRNCRIMVSSGSQKRDTNACQSTPVCYARTADEVTDCRELTFLEMAATMPGNLVSPGIERAADLRPSQVQRAQARARRRAGRADRARRAEPRDRAPARQIAAIAQAALGRAGRAFRTRAGAGRMSQHQASIALVQRSMGRTFAPRGV